MCVEVTVILKDDEKTCRQKFLHYGILPLCPEAVEIEKMVQEAKLSFNGEPTDVIIRTSMSL